MDVIFTDLDGTLLDHNTYSWEAARPALDRLRLQGVPWILVTSKTRAEVEFWRRRLDNEHPFIIENGGGAFVPVGYFPFAARGGKRRDSYEVIEWGMPYEQLVADLQKASQTSHCRVRGFHEMTAEEVARLCNLPLEQAVLAKQREYDEPFVVLDPDRAGALAAAIGDLGRRSTRGGRFWHILGASDKAQAVEALSAIFGQGNTPVRTIGLGDGLNDASFLNVVAAPVLIRSPQAAELLVRVPRGAVTDLPGPEGWNAAVLALIGD
ncbi:MAG: HAD-IIB family hydrolase [Candidatus Solibacter sp.]